MIFRINDKYQNVAKYAEDKIEIQERDQGRCSCYIPRGDLKPYELTRCWDEEHIYERTGATEFYGAHMFR